MRVHDYLDWHAREHPDDGFAVFGDQALSYSEAAIEANRIARAFEEAGIGPGERVAVLAQNSLDYVLLYFGAFKAGVVLVPLNYRLAPPEWSYIVNDAGAKLLLADPPFTSGIDEIRDQLGSVDRFIEIGGTAGPGWEKLADLLGDSAATPPERVISEDDDLYQMYTSGTTGRPKGAVLTHRAVTANLHQLGPLFNLGPGDRYLIVAPLYHAAAGVATLACVAAGGTIVIQQDFDPQAVVKALSEERIAGTTLVPAMIQACLVFVPDVAERSYDELRFIIYGASPIAEPTLRRAIEVFG
ncbi:MAG: AMP-binding protein, partial [Myxococcota bacterium]|nr:AMP-binding protein [Myxococcota bacterium]